MPTIAIVGAGPSGASAARALLAENAGFDIDLYESRQSFGGLWNYSPTHGPMYRTMDANVPRSLIGFTGFPLAPGSFYPTREEVLQYLIKYTQDVTRSLHVNVYFGEKVLKVVKQNGKWRVETGSRTGLYDFVVLASGHYEFPYIPPIGGLLNNPIAIHSVEYDTPEEFLGKKVLIIGNARSATDLAIQILGVTHPISISRRHEGPTDSVFDKDPGAVNWKSEVSRVENCKVIFSDGTEDVFDRIVVSTGYLYEFPFLELGVNGLHHKSRLRLQNIYKHTFYTEDPTLTTIAINKGMVPFPAMETQAAVIARVWSGRLTLPPHAEMKREEYKTESIHGSEERFHELTMYQDIKFLQDLWQWADQAPGGFEAEHWTPKKVEFRKECGSIKAKDYARRVLESKARRQSSSI